METVMRSFLLATSLLALLMGCRPGADSTPDAAATVDANAPGSVPIAAVSVDALYVVNGTANSISVIDAAQRTVIGTIELKNVSFPHHVYLSPDRSKLVVGVPGIDFSAGHAHAGH